MALRGVVGLGRVHFGSLGVFCSVAASNGELGWYGWLGMYRLVEESCGTVGQGWQGKSGPGKAGLHNEEVKQWYISLSLVLL